MSAPCGLRELMDSYGLRMLRQKLRDGRSRVWLDTLMLTDGDEANPILVNGEGADVDLAILAYVLKLRGKTALVSRGYPDSFTVELPSDFGLHDMAEHCGLVRFEEMYDINNPPPAPEPPAAVMRYDDPGDPTGYRQLLWLGRPMVDEQTAGPLELMKRRDAWHVILGPRPEPGSFNGGLNIVVTGTASDIDAKTRAWLAPLVQLSDELVLAGEKW